MDVHYMCILKENILVVLFIFFYFLEIFCRSSKENCKKRLTVAIVAESICFECSKQKRILKREEDMYPWYAWGTALSKRTFCNDVNRVAPSA